MLDLNDDDVNAVLLLNEYTMELLVYIFPSVNCRGDVWDICDCFRLDGGKGMAVRMADGASCWQENNRKVMMIYGLMSVYVLGI